MSGRPVVQPSRWSSLKRRTALVAAVVTALSGLGGLTALPASASATDPCAAPTNPVVCENSKPGTPEVTWDPVTDDPSILGFATDISVNAGSSVSFKVNTTLAYTIQIYRLGYYNGNGARLQATLTPTPRTQPACLTDTTTKLLDCGNWAVSATWAVPSTAVSGVYVARLDRNDQQGASLVPFVVRNDASTAQIYFQTSDTTWQAYNNYGNNNLYGGVNYDSANRAYKVSYNRPFLTRSWENGRDYLFASEYATIRFLEANGYDVAYSTGVDTHRLGSLIQRHKVFLTVGHDEYWSGTARANVKAARDAGVHLAFLTGNDNYWKTRFEQSIDGSNTDNRTLVCYKETWNGAKIDPSSEWTGTWRDPRLSPPADGGLPENELGGTIFMSNVSDMPLTVSSTEGKLRFWRNAGLSAIPTGQTVDVGDHLVGYESNEDLDNGFRPAGLIRMSTSVSTVPALLKDFGATTGSGTTTHHITMYRAASGALVFSAGTVQWGFGLDASHDYIQTPASPKVQQATVNLLADMGAQPLTLDPALTIATASTDTTKPVSAITSPAAGSSIANGATVTVQGTASDTGGLVAAVEVSTDGGATWHLATGTTSWSYTYNVRGKGTVAIKSRAVDDSGNIETPSAGVSVSHDCPCSLFGLSTPGTVNAGDTSAVELGVRFQPNEPGYVTAIRFYKSTANTGTHVGRLWSSSGTLLASGTFTNETASGWQTLTLANPVPVQTGVNYVVSYTAPAGGYSVDSLAFSYRPWVSGPLSAVRSLGTVKNGLFGTPGSFPTSSYQDSNYYVDVSFSPSAAIPPTVVSVQPRAGQVGVATRSTTVEVSFAGEIVTGTPALAVATTTGGTPVAGTTTFNAQTSVLTFTPSAPLAPGTQFTATVSGAATSTGATMSPQSWSFTTDTRASCPCSVFGSNSVPAVADAGDTNAVELGTRFVPSVDGLITGVRFYKSAGNTGPHTGSLWSANGTRLATGTFVNETASGWQTLTFSAPVAVTAGTVYTASYYAPVGRYAADGAFFASDFRSGTLTAPATGGNGVYAYGGGGIAPTNSFNATNYWVDATFLPANSPPDVTLTSPVAGATNIPVNSTVSAAFSLPVQSSTVAFTLTGPGTTPVPGTVTYDAPSATATFTPTSPLSGSVTYTATVSGAVSTTGITMAGPSSWTFTTRNAATCPCSLFGASDVPATLDSGDTASVELGVRFTPDVNGTVTGVKFYKGTTANGGTHTGTLWSGAGVALATGTFTNETDSGWQTLTFAAPVAVTAGQTYIASYRAPTGRYSVTGAYFTTDKVNGPLAARALPGNGVFTYNAPGTPPTDSYNAGNYWVDVVFTGNGGGTGGGTTDTTPPTVTTWSPANGATAVTGNATVSATFSEDVAAGTVSMTLRQTVAGTAVAGATVYTAGTRTATFTPSSALLSNTQYTATVTATDVAGNAMPSAATVSFTTGDTAAPTVTTWTPAAAATGVSTGDQSVNLALTGVASASSSITSTDWNLTNVNDGVTTSVAGDLGWSSNNSLTVNHSEYVRIDLGAATSVGRVVLFPRSDGANAGYGFPVDFTIRTSVDGTTWTTATTNTAYPLPTATAQAFSFAGRSARYVEVNATSLRANPNDGNQFRLQLAEFQVFGPSVPTVSAVLSEAATPASVVMSLRETASGTAVTGTTVYSSTTNTAVFTPSVALAGGTQYTASVSATDLAGNAMTAPATSTFTTVDSAAPVISAVAASGSGTTATVTWTTNEASSTVVRYGTSATALTSTATGTSGVTAHSATLTGLTPNTRYYYRVFSADAAGNPALAPAPSAAAASYAPAIAAQVRTTVADFAAGTNSSTYVANAAGGELILTPTLSNEFDGTALGANWSSTTVVSGGTSPVSGGAVTPDGAYVRTSASYGTTAVVEMSGTLGTAANRFFGFGVTNAATGTRIGFTTGAGNQLVAVTRGGALDASSTSTTLSASLATGTRTYRVERTATTSRFLVDGVVVATHNLASTTNLVVGLRDDALAGGGPTAAWMRVLPYTVTSGTWTSPVLDGLAPVAWGAISSVSTLNGGTVTVQTRTGGTAAPDATWTAWTTRANGAVVGTTSRYLQYRVTITSPNTTNSPSVDSVTVASSAA